MAKKGAVRDNSEQKNSAAPRKGLRTLADLAAEIERIKVASAELAATARMIKDRGFQAVEVDGIQKLERGLELLAEYNTAVQIGLLRHKSR